MAHNRRSPLRKKARLIMTSGQTTSVLSSSLEFPKENLNLLPRELVSLTSPASSTIANCSLLRAGSSRGSLVAHLDVHLVGWAPRATLDAH